MAPARDESLGSTFDEMADRIERRSQELETAVRQDGPAARAPPPGGRNNFQLVASLLSLEARDADAVLQAASGRSRTASALAIAHRVAMRRGRWGRSGRSPHSGSAAGAAPERRLPNDLLDLTVTGAAPADARSRHRDPVRAAPHRASARRAAGRRRRALAGRRGNRVRRGGRGDPARPRTRRDAPKELGARLVEAFRRQLKAEVEADFAASRFEIRMALSSSGACDGALSRIPLPRLLAERPP